MQPSVAADAPSTKQPAPKRDSLREALEELARPLLPVPTADAGQPELGMTPKVVFCDTCNRSIPHVHLELHLAGELDGKMWCKDCLEKQNLMLEVADSFEIPQSTVKPAPHLDDILAGPKGEALVVGTTPPPARPGSGSRGHGQAAPLPGAAADAEKIKKKPFGDEFEEIGNP
jgi:hypothetical protein